MKGRLNILPVGGHIYGQNLPVERPIITFYYNSAGPGLNCAFKPRRPPSLGRFYLARL